MILSVRRVARLAEIQAMKREERIQKMFNSTDTDELLVSSFEQVCARPMGNPSASLLRRTDVNV